MSSSSSRSAVERAGGGGEVVAGAATERGAAGSGKKGSEPALSASLILLTILPEPAEDGHDYRVLLLKRHESSRTYTNAYVFPGGNVDPIDGATSAWSSFFPSLAPFTVGVPSPPSTSASVSSSLSDVDLQTVKLCALRETFEESGVLLFEALSESEGAHEAALVQAEKTWSDKNGLRKTELREEVHKDGGKFVEVFEKELGGEVRPAVGRLTHWANWITPLGLPRRFDTHFFISILPRASSSHFSHSLLATCDGVETSSAEWLTPAEAIHRALAHVAQLPSHQASIPSTTAQYAPQPASMGDNPSNAIILHPPQFYLLAELAHNHKSYRSLLAGGSATGNSSSPPVVRPRTVRSFTPQIARVPDSSGKTRGATLLPGDEDFMPPSSDLGDAFVVRELGEGSAGGERKGQGKIGGRHRTYVLPPGKGVQGLTVLGVHRKGMQDELGEGWEDMQAGDIGKSGPTQARL